MTIDKTIEAIAELPDGELSYYEAGDGRAYQYGGCEHYESGVTGADLKQLAAERDKYRDACERLIATGANLVKVIEAATVIETMFVMGHRKDKAFQEVEQIVGAKNLLKWQLADAADFARQVEAEIKGESK